MADCWWLKMLLGLVVTPVGAGASHVEHEAPAKSRPIMAAASAGPASP